MNFLLTFTLLILISFKGFSQVKPTVPEDFFNSLDSLLEINQIEKADSVAQNRLSWCEKNLGENDTTTAWAAYRCANVFWGREPHKVRKWLLAAEEKQRKSGYINTNIYGYYIHGIGQLHFALSELSLALEYFERALELRKKINGEAHTVIAESYSAIGKVYQYMNKYDLAIEYGTRSLEMSRKLHGENSQEVANTYNDLGQLYLGVSQYGKAVENFEKAKQISIQLNGENTIEVAGYYNNLGSAYKSLLEKDKALEYYKKSNFLVQKLLGERHPYNAIGQNNIGTVYYSQDEPIIARSYFEKALSINNELFGEESIEVAHNIGNIGMAYYASNEYDKALEYYNRALEIRKKFFEEKHSVIADCYRIIGQVLFSKKDTVKSIEYLQKAIYLFSESIGEKHSSYARANNDLGRMYMNIGQSENALQSYHKGVISSLLYFNDTDVNQAPIIKDVIDHITLYDALEGKVTLLIKNNNIESALQHLFAIDTLVIQTMDQMRNKQDQLVMANRLAVLGWFGSETCSKLYEKTKDKKYKNLSFYFALRSQSSVLQGQIAEKQALSSQLIPDTLAIKEQSLRSELNLCREKLAALQDDNERKPWEERIFSVERNLESIYSYLELNFPKYYELKHSTDQVKLSDLQKSLHKKQAVIMYQVNDSCLYLHTITSKEYTIEKRKTPDLDKITRGIRNSMVLQLEPAFKAVSKKLHEYLKPSLSRKYKDLLIIPQGVLTSLPFEVLIDDNEKYWLESYSIAYSYSPTLWYNTFVRDEELPYGKIDFFAIAPVFDHSGNTEGFLVRSEILQEIQKDTISTRSMFSLNHKAVATLPGTEMEIMEISVLFDYKGKLSEIRTRDKSTESELRQLDLSQFKYLHFATHGFVNTEKPELSGFMLAHETDSTRTEDGLFMMGEIMGLNLNARLVCLSACETGLGKQSKGEGLLGLSRAFIYAGSRNILVSLWKVSDDSTKELMISIYNEILNDESLPISYAVQKAKLKMVKEGTYKEPYFWAPFILIGE